MTSGPFLVNLVSFWRLLMTPFGSFWSLDCALAPVYWQALLGLPVELMNSIEKGEVAASRFFSPFFYFDKEGNRKQEENG